MIIAVQHERGPRKPRLKESLSERAFSLHHAMACVAAKSTTSVATVTNTSTPTSRTTTGVDRLPFNLPLLQQQQQQQQAPGTSVKGVADLTVAATASHTVASSVSATAGSGGGASAANSGVRTSGSGGAGAPLLLAGQHLTFPFHLWPTLHFPSEKTTTTATVRHLAYSTVLAMPQLKLFQ